MLQGFPEYQTDEIPTCALFNPSSVIPVAYNMACDAPCDFGCVTVAETVLSLGSELSWLAWRIELEDKQRLDDIQQL
jgi:hypothetical protein